MNPFILTLITAAWAVATAADTAIPVEKEINAIAVTCETPTERGVKCKPKTPTAFPTCKTGTALTYNERTKAYTCEKAWAFTGTNSNGITVGNTNNLNVSFNLSNTASMTLEQSGRIIIYGGKDGKKLVVVETDGTAKLYGKPNEAARVFWAAVARYRPDCKK